MKPVALTELMKNVSADFTGGEALLRSRTVGSICTDTRTLRRGDLFVALRGDVHDGHDFIGSAVAAGASTVIFETAMKAAVRSFVSRHPDVLFIGVHGTRKAFGSIARNYRRRFSPVRIAVTGSVGKTTTKTFIHRVLSKRFKVVASIRSYNNDIGVPKTLLEIDESTEVLVQELGTNHPGEIEYLAGLLEPDCGVITNIGPAHIGFFGTEENIAGEKKHAVSVLPKTGCAFLNAEDKYFDFLRADLAAEVRSFGLRKGDLHPEKIIEIGIGDSTFVIDGVTIRLPAAGVHSVVNGVCAALVGGYFGLSTEEIKDALENIPPQEGRGRIFEKAGALLIDETYNANPLSVSASIDYLGSVGTGGRRIFVLGDMLELGEGSDSYHRDMAGRIMKSGVDILYTYGSKASLTAEACMEGGLGEVHAFGSIDELSETLRKTLRAGDIVLFKASRAVRLERAFSALIGEDDYDRR